MLETKESIQDGHERILRKVFSEQFNIAIPRDLTHDQKHEIKNEMWLNNLKAVTAKLPDTNTYSTMIFDSNKRLVYAFLVKHDENGKIVSEEFKADQGDILAVRIGQEIYSQARSYRNGR